MHLFCSATRNRTNHLYTHHLHFVRMQSLTSSTVGSIHQLHLVSVLLLYCCIAVLHQLMFVDWYCVLLFISMNLLLVPKKAVSQISSRYTGTLPHNQYRNDMWNKLVYNHASCKNCKIFEQYAVMRFRVYPFFSFLLGSIADPLHAEIQS